MSIRPYDPKLKAQIAALIERGEQAEAVQREREAAVERARRDAILLLTPPAGTA